MMDIARTIASWMTAVWSWMTAHVVICALALVAIVILIVAIEVVCGLGLAHRARQAERNIKPG